MELKFSRASTWIQSKKLKYENTVDCDAGGLNRHSGISCTLQKWAINAFIHTKCSIFGQAEASSGTVRFSQYFGIYLENHLLKVVESSDRTCSSWGVLTRLTSIQCTDQLIECGNGINACFLRLKTIDDFFPLFSHSNFNLSYLPNELLLLLCKVHVNFQCPVNIIWIPIK